MPEYLLREALNKHHWHSEYLSWDRRLTQLDIKHGRAVYRPFRFWKRLKNINASLPVSHLIAVGDEIAFKDTLAGDRLF
jgi:hypothetical protein